MMQYLEFTLPPLPHYLISSTDTYQPGETHLSRKNIGVFDLLVLREGALYMAEEQEKWRITKGDALILLPDAAHVCWRPCDSVTRFYWLHFQTVGQWHCAAQPSQPHLDNNFYVYSPINKFSVSILQYQPLQDPEAMYTMLDELNDIQKDNSARGMWKQQLVFQRVLMALSTMDQQQWQSPCEELAGKTVRFLMENFDHPIDNDTLKEHLSYHPTYINRCMKTCYGCTALEFLRRYRIERSKLYLLQTERPIEFISSKIGFNSAAHYSKCFRQLLGCSPQQFRKEYSHQAKEETKTND